MDFIRRQQNRLPFLTILTVVISCTPIQANAGTFIEVAIGGLEGSSCEGVSRLAIVSGSTASVSVVVLSTDQAKETQEFAETKPEWLSLEFSYGTEWDSFNASPELSRLLNPEYFLEVSLLDAEAFISNGEKGDRSSLTCFFAIDIPETLKGSFCVRAVAAPPPYGPLAPAHGPHSRNLACIQIVTPCSEEDENKALASRIAITRRMGKYSEALNMADSLVAIGWRSYDGLEYAVNIASKLRRFDSALHFLDVQYETYGSVGAREAMDFPPFEILPVDPERALAEYSRQRESLLQAKRDYEQKK